MEIWFPALPLKLMLKLALLSLEGLSSFIHGFQLISFSQTHLPPICLHNVCTLHRQNNQEDDRTVARYKQEIKTMPNHRKGVVITS